MARIFKYRRTAEGESTQPAIPITLFGSESKAQFLAILDSGSSETFIPMWVAQKLGCQIKSEPIDVKVPADEKKAYGSKVRIEVDLGYNKFDREIECLVMDGLLEIILGRHSFFQFFEITFVEKEKRLKLKQIETKPR